MNKILGLIMLVLLVFATLRPSDLFAASIFEGRKLFRTYCFLCHGMGGKGDGPLAQKLDSQVSDLTDDSRMGKKSDKSLLRLIRGGTKHGEVKMPKWGKGTISEPQIKSIIAYLRFMHRSKHQLIGDPDAGGKVYMQYCSLCHGKDGRGDGVVTHIIPIKPIDHTNRALMDKISNVALTNIIVKGGTELKSYMPGWSDILSETEIRDLVGYIRMLSH